MLVFLVISIMVALSGFLLNLSIKTSQTVFGKFLKMNSIHRIVIWFCVFLFFLFSSILIYTGFLNPTDYQPYYERLLPLGLFVIISSIQSILLLLSFGSDKDPKIDHRNLLFLKRSIIVFLIESIVFLIIKVTGLGITPDPMDWQPNGMTVQYWELSTAFLFGSFLLVISLLLHNKMPEIFQTILFFVILWITASLLWTSVSSSEFLKHSYFMEITPPNNVPYPASDAAYFGLWSESLINGLGFKNSVVSRQFYVVLLAFFQMMAKKNILLAIDIQTIFLALIPAMLFLIGKQLHSAGAGLFAAGIAILREYNSLLLAPHFGMSNSKMFLSDLPTLLFFLFFLSAFISWYQNSDSKNKAILAGGLLGLVTLIRSQFILFFLLVIVLVIFRRKTLHRKIFYSFLIFSITLFAVLAPSLIRSMSVKGTFFLEDNDIHGAEIVRRYSDPDEKIPSTMNSDIIDKSLYQIGQFIVNKPFYVMQFISNHFLKNQIDSWLVLPVGMSFTMTAEDILDTSYHEVTQRLSNHNVLSILFFAVLIACGFAACMNAHGFTGLIPFVLCSMYMAATAAGRYSGWRFILPSDWIFYLYFSAGIFEIIQRIFKNFKLKQNLNTAIQKKKPAAFKKSIIQNWKPFVLFFTLIGTGSLPVSLPYLIPNQMMTGSQSENLQIIEKMAFQYGKPFRSMLQQTNEEKLLIINGKTIYPRYFEAGQGLTSANPWTVYEVRDFNRLGFILLNQENTNIIIPMESEPVFIPNDTDCLVIGNQSGNGYFEGIWLIFPAIIDSNGKPLTFSN